MLHFKFWLATEKAMPIAQDIQKQVEKWIKVWKCAATSKETNYLNCLQISDQVAMHQSVGATKHARAHTQTAIKCIFKS